MPLYLLKCTKCGHTFEKLTPFSRLGEAVCEKCGEKAERVYAGASIAVFTGKGARSSSCGGCTCPNCAGCGNKS